MTKREYAAYERDVAAFFQAEGITNLSPVQDEPFFSTYMCECCLRPLAGDRYKASGFNPTTEEITTYEVCTDCIYYVSYGQLDDETMLDMEEA